MADGDARAGTLERGLAILELLGRTGPIGASAIAEELDVSRSATYRILGILRDHGYVNWTDRADRVELGFAVINQGMAALSALRPVSEAQENLRALSAELAESALLGVREGDEMVYLAQEARQDHSLTMRPLLGTRRYMHSTSLGKAYLAALPLDELEPLLDRLRLVKQTATTITTKDALSQELKAISARGYAIDDAENEDGVRCFGAAVRDHRGLPVCAISAAGPKERMTAKQDQAIGLVVATADRISRRLGWAGQKS